MRKTTKSYRETTEQLVEHFFLHASKRAKERARQEAAALMVCMGGPIVFLGGGLLKEPEGPLRLMLAKSSELLCVHPVFAHRPLWIDTEICFLGAMA